MACMMPTKGATLHNSMMGSPASWPASIMDSGIAGRSGPVSIAKAVMPRAASWRT